MSETKRSNLRFVMKQAHKNARYLMEYAKREARKGNTEYAEMNYRLTFAECMKKLLNASIKTAPVKKVFGAAPITNGQKQTIAEIRNILGSKWDGTRGSKINTISKQQAQIEIDRNMATYLEEKELGFCTVRTWQAILNEYNKAGVQLSIKRRQVKEASALTWLSKRANKAV